MKIKTEKPLKKVKALKQQIVREKTLLIDYYFDSQLNKWKITKQSKDM